MKSLVIGLGESGLAAARWLACTGRTVRVADTRANPGLLDTLRQVLPGVEFSGGALTTALFDQVDQIIVSPGLSPHHAPLRALIDEADARQIPWFGEIDLFARALADLEQSCGYSPRLIGVTGTNGKTTTVRMAAAMIAKAGQSVCVAGNVSPSALDALREMQANGTLPDYWVLELSSFQLATTRHLNCDAATILNVTEDHLDWHPDMADYAHSKERIFSDQTVRVLNRDDPYGKDWISRSDAALTWTFGIDAPTRGSQYGLSREAGLLWLSCTEPLESETRRRRGRTSVTTAVVESDIRATHLMPLDALLVRGTHNATNAMAALALVRAVGIPLAPALRALQSFRADAHRTQWVATVDAVDYIDDSKGTNVGATIAALRGLSTSDGERRIVAILGGDGKGQDFSPLAIALTQTAHAAVLIGRDAERILQALAGTSLTVRTAPTLPAAVDLAAGLAQPGDLVLLSPACASLDMFRNYAHRAEVFVDAVRRLEATPNHDEGVSC